MKFGTRRHIPTQQDLQTHFRMADRVHEFFSVSIGFFQRRMTGIEKRVGQKAASGRILAPVNITMSMYRCVQACCANASSAGAVSGRIPRQSKKDSAACSTSMPHPLVVRAAWRDFAHRVNGVCPRP